MKRLTDLADRVLSVVAPKGTAAACGGCRRSGPFAGPCTGGYGYLVCCNVAGPGGCFDHCTFVC